MNKFLENSDYIKGLKKEKGVINKIIYSYTYFLKYFFKSPTRVIVTSFAFFILLGAIFLSNPISSRNGENINFLDALFTSTSAVCVTGLSCFDIGIKLSYFGQFIVMVLIQVGGLGFMTVTSFLFLLMGKRITLQQRLVIKESFDENNVKGVVNLINKIVIYTISIESIVAVILLGFFIPAFSGNIKKSIFFAIFHSVSSFCNAGFDLMSLVPNGAPGTSLTLFYNKIILILPIAVNIFIGGLGFSVMNDIKKRIGGKKLPTHTKLVLISSFSILAVGSLIVFLLERNNTMKNMTVGEQILNSIFQVITTRTAGFATVNQGELTIGTRLLSELFMFVGASPGSTGGGIKTTTFILLLIIAYKTIIGKREVNILRREVKENIIKRILTIVVFAATSIFLSIIIISCIENGKVITLDSITFETISAFSTTGLSYGITGDLTRGSRFILGLLMFIGRCGTITIGSAMTLRLLSSKKSKINYPDIKIRLG